MAENVHLSPVQVETCAGLLAGTVTTLIVHPLDIIKTRLQTQRQTASGPLRSWAILYGLVYQDKPLQRLYRGLTPNLLGNAGSWAVFFSGKSMIEAQILRSRGRHEATARVPPRRPGGSRDGLTPLEYFCASGLAGMLITLSTNPIWVLKTRMLSSERGQRGAYTSMWDGARQVLRHEGLRGFYKGVGVSLLGNSHGAIQFGVYEPVKRIWLQSFTREPRQPGRSDGKLSVTATLVISGGAKIIAGTCTYPLQVLRSRLQAHRCEHVFGKGMREVSRQVWQEQGWRGFYKGVGINVIRVLPATWVTFLVYENAKHYLSTFAR